MHTKGQTRYRKHKGANKGRKHKKGQTMYIIDLFILFIGIVYIILMIICKNRNWNIYWVVKWEGKIDKIGFEDI